MQEDRLHWGYSRELPLPNDPILHASVLAALGRLPEACAVAQVYIDRDEGKWLAIRADATTLLAKPRRRSEGESRMQLTNHFLQPMNDMRGLITFASASDRPAVAALLHQWEEQNVKRVVMEDVWEPTPFPLERGL